MDGSELWFGQRRARPDAGVRHASAAPDYRFWTRLFFLSSVAVAALSANDLCVVNRHRVADDVSALTVDFYLTFDLANLGDGDGCADHCGYREPCADRRKE